MSKLLRVWALGVGCGLLVASVSTEAFAQGFTWGRGTFSGGPRFGSDDLDFGVGINAGGTLDSGPYIGGLFDFYFGESDEGTTVFGSYETSFHAWFLMPEGGYDFGVADNVVIRPTLALGVVHGFGEVCIETGGVTDCEDYSDSEFNGALSGVALFSTGALMLGGEVRLLFGEIDGIWIGFNLGADF